MSYQHSDYQRIQNIVSGIDNKGDKIAFSVEFTDNATGTRSFARYSHIKLTDGDYTLMLVYQSSEFIKHIALDGGFEELSTVLINEDGSYILRNEDYKSDSFYKFLYLYNDLSLAEKSSIKKRVLSNDNGTLRYLNNEKEECAYVYTNVSGTDWHCISEVPLASFHNSEPDFRFTIIVTVLLLLMMLMNLLYLSYLNKCLRISATQAHAANEAKTDFLSRMSHDIRTPINVINGMTELAISPENPPQTAEYLNNIKSSGKFLLGLVNDILDMNKVESGKMELHEKPYRYSEFIRYIKAVIIPLCEEKHITFTMNEDVASMMIMTDPLRFNQIFFNLLSNAVKFTPVGGHVSLICTIIATSDSHVQTSFTVSDDGLGMSEEFQKTMYNSFSQEERTENDNKNGTGLGLAIVKKLVELMYGDISVQSKPGEGTVFSLYFEFATCYDIHKQEKTKVKLSNLEGKRILLCEDHPLNAQIIIQLFARKKAFVDVAENGKEGIDKLLASADGYYDAILMDVRMPVMNGIDATREIRKITNRTDAPKIPIIALTANAYDSDVQACLDAGMNTHLAKPIEPDVLYSTVVEQLSVKYTK